MSALDNENRIATIEERMDTFEGVLDRHLNECKEASDQVLAKLQGMADTLTKIKVAQIRQFSFAGGVTAATITIVGILWAGRDVVVRLLSP